SHPPSCSWSGHHRVVRSFPTRRSSDLAQRRARGSCASGLRASVRATIQIGSWWVTNTTSPLSVSACASAMADIIRARIEVNGSRSEEHTSELQSRENLVCRLLLEKKKK